MGSQGGNAPNPYTQHQASTLFLRVPSIDWRRVKIGEKTEFRTMPREGSRLTSCNVPTPVVAYAIAAGPMREFDRRLLLLQERRFEPLIMLADDPEGVAREGFESYDHFRRYWRARRKGVYRATQKVWVWRVRPFEAGDLDKEGRRLLLRLYGDYLDQLHPDHL